MPVEPIERQPGKWLYDYHDVHGKRRWGTAGDKSTALTIQAEREKEWRLVREGVLKPEQLLRSRASGRPIEAQIREYEEHLRGKRVGDKHLKNSIDALRRVVGWLGAGTAAAIALERVESLFNRKMEGGMGPRMRNFYVKLLKAFLEEMEDRNQVLRNPLRKMRAINEEVDQRNVSRPLTHAEFDQLLAPLAMPAPEEGKELVVTPQLRRRAERRTFYLLVARTGMRWEEAGRLSWNDLDAARWWLEVGAGQAKTKRGASLPVPTDLVEALQEWRKLAPAGDGVLFPSGVPTLKTWKRDLVAAGLVQLPPAQKFASKQRKKKGKGEAAAGYVDRYAKTKELAGYADKDGCKLHRKCLRLTFGTWLYEAGVDIREAQRLMRHADINLTSKIYTRPRLVNLQAAAEKVAEARKPAAYGPSAPGTNQAKNSA
jgi:integrase